MGVVTYAEYPSAVAAHNESPMPFGFDGSGYVARRFPFPP